MNIIARITKWIEHRQLEKNIAAICSKYDYDMEKIAVSIFNTPRAKSIKRTRQGFIIGTENRGIVELRGTDNVIEWVLLNPQKESTNG